MAVLVPQSKAGTGLRMSGFCCLFGRVQGSTCCMVESMLRHSDCRTGLYTSPHLVRGPPGPTALRCLALPR